MDTEGALGLNLIVCCKKIQMQSVMLNGQIQLCTECLIKVTSTVSTSNNELYVSKEQKPLQPQYLENRPKIKVRQKIELHTSRNRTIA